MQDIETLINDLIKEVTNDVTLARELLVTLQLEKVALEKKDIDQIEAITEKKASLILSLKENQTRRDNIQQQLHAPIGFKGLQYILKKFNLQNNSIFKKISQELEQLLLDIRKLTEINSKIIAISQAQTARIIDIIYGRENTSYGEAAQIHTTSISNTITKA